MKTKPVLPPTIDSSTTPSSKKPFSKKLLYVLLIVLYTVGISLVVFKLSNRASQSIVTTSTTTTPAGSIRKEHILPFPVESIKVTDLIWKTYQDNDLKIKFSYPINLPSQQYPKTQTSISKSNNSISVMFNMAPIFTINKSDTFLPLEQWIEKEKLRENPHYVLTKTEFRNKQAYYVHVISTQQVPGDFYVIQYDDSIFLVNFRKPESVREVVNDYKMSKTAGVLNQAELDTNLETMAKYDDEYYMLDNIINERMLSSIEFL